MKKILIVTGGSGGHVVPATTLYEHLRNNFKVKIVTDLRGSKFIDKNKFNYDLIDVPKLFSRPYILPINIFRYLFKIFNSINFLKKNNIDIVISTGGYMSFPFCVAAFFLKKKIFLFEPNSVLGRSNKFVLRLSTKIICYDQNLKNYIYNYNNKKIISEPILKKKIYEIKKNSFYQNKKIKKILIIGGSQGASFFDKTITELIIQISKKHKFEINQQITNSKTALHIKEKYKNAKIKYNFFKFTNNSDEIYKDVDLAITRGGASTLSELSFLNIPFIVIPLPSAKDNHQFHNANYYYKKKGCWLVEQFNFKFDELQNLILMIFDNNKDYVQKIHNLKKISEKNTWNNTNNHIIEIFNEN